MRRRALTLATGGVVVLGLVVSRGTGPAADLAGGALYAALVDLLCAFVRPGAAPRRVGLVALVVCVAVELAQLTGGPAALVDLWNPLHYALGTTFAAPDLLAYAAGAAVAAALDTVVGRGQRPPRPGEPTARDTTATRKSAVGVKGRSDHVANRWSSRRPAAATSSAKVSKE